MSRERILPQEFCTTKDQSRFENSDAVINEQLQAELAELYENVSSSFQEGKIAKGKVISVDSDGILVDINYKSQGFIPRHEFGSHEIKKFKAGDEIEVMIENLENIDGIVVLSYEKAKAMRVWDDITKLFEEEKPVEGIVTHKVKGGLNVDIGIPAFLPGSQIDLQRVLDFDHYVGQTITANILKINKKRGNVIISRRKYLHDLRSGERKKILDTLSEGQVIQGVVKNITNYGVFIEIGGIDGLLHITDMTWGRIAHPSEMVKIGDVVSVKVLSFDRNTEKISLGMKQLTENPWAAVDKTLKAGDKIKGRISSITDYGLFVEVAPHIEGLVHISEVSWTDRITNLSKMFNVGDQIETLIVSLDKDNRRMSLSVKQLEKNPWEAAEKEFKVGQTIKGKISNITDFGIFVQLSSGIDGLVHISDFSWTEHIGHPGDQYKLSQEVEAVILSVDKENKKISLGIKQLTPDPWENIEQTYSVGDIIEGEVSKIANFGAFVKLPSGIEGLLHNSILAYEQSGKKASDLYTVGQKISLRITNINKEDRKVALSTKLEASAAQPQPQQAPQQPSLQQPQQQQAQTQAQKSPKKFVKRDRDEEKVKHTSSTTTSKMKGSLQMALESAMQGVEKDESKDELGE